MARKVFIFLGPPGSGKGTQSDMLAQASRLPAIATGELLRSAIGRQTVLGRQAGGYVKRGELVPDKLIHELMAKRLKRPDAKNGFILDGYPRDKAQLDDFLTLVQDKYDLWVINIEVSAKEVINRLSGRRVCLKCGATWHLLYKPPKKAGICDECGARLVIRADDKPAVVKERLKHYQEQAAPVLGLAKSRRRLVTIDGEQSIAQVHRAIATAVAKIKLHGK